MNGFFTRTSLLLTALLVTQSASAARMYCMCCDDELLIELVVKKCRAVRIEPELLTFTSKPSYDLVITGTMISSINYTSAMELKFDELQTGQHIEHDFVYARSPEPSCEDFQVGMKKLMLYTPVGCVLMDGEQDFGDDTTCLYGGHAISRLPQTLRDMLKQETR